MFFSGISHHPAIHSCIEGGGGVAPHCWLCNTWYLEVRGERHGCQKAKTFLTQFTERLQECEEVILLYPTWPTTWADAALWAHHRQSGQSCREKQSEAVCCYPECWPLMPQWLMSFSLQMWLLQPASFFSWQLFCQALGRWLQQWRSRTLDRFEKKFATLVGLKPVVLKRMAAWGRQIEMWIQFSEASKTVFLSLLAGIPVLEITDTFMLLGQLVGKHMKLKTLIINIFNQ